MTAGAIVRQVYEAWNAGDLDAIDRLWNADCELSFPGMTLRGRDQVKAYLGGFMAAFPDFHHTILNLIESGDMVAVELTGSGTHTGTLRFPIGVIPPTGQRVDGPPGCDFVQVANGKIASWHIYTDMGSFVGQLGVSPAGAQPALA